MDKKPGFYLLLIIGVAFLLYGVIFAMDRIANAAANPTPSNSPPDAQTMQKATTEFLAKICSNHGGINCSILDEVGSIHCNDGTIDESLPTIYAVPQCQKTIESIVNGQSDFMAESGCYPPSEITCFNEQSYQNLTKIFTNSKLVDSELAKNELAQCRQEMAIYQARNAEYRQCLTENNKSDFVSPSKMMVPILKVIFCPVFYGERASYDDEADLCICDSGYFKSNGKCADASFICQSKYGYDASAQNGDCHVPPKKPATFTPTPYIAPTISTRIIPPVSRASPTPIFSPSLPVSTPNLSEVQPRKDLVSQTTTPSTMTQEETALKPNPISWFFNTIMSGLKNILNLF